MTDRPRKDGPDTPAPDGEPRPRPSDPDSTRKSKVSEVQDPLISGDAGKGGRTEADEAKVDEAGQVRRKKGEVDMLH